jgi:hypothetical protein
MAISPEGNDLRNEWIELGWNGIAFSDAPVNPDPWASRNSKSFERTSRWLETLVWILGA